METKKCSNCGEIHEKGTKFCTTCGSPMIEKIFCSHCGIQATDDIDNCPQCGKPLKENEKAPEKVLNPSQGELDSKGMITGKIKVFLQHKSKTVMSVFAIVLIIAAAFTGFALKPNKDHSLLYIKDNELNFTFIPKIKAFQVSEKFLDTTSGLNISQSQVDEMSNNDFVHYCNDGKIMFYPDRINDNGKATYYYRNLLKDNTKADAAIKLDSDINLYNGIQISEDGKRAFYTKGSDGKLYYNNMTDKEKIDSNVSSFFVDPAGEYIIYTKDGNMICEKDIKGNTAISKIDSDALISHVSSDLSKIYYMKENTLYIKEKGSDKREIASNINGELYFNDSGCYYEKTDEVKYKLSDYVDDDLLAADQNIMEPNINDYQKTVRRENYFYGYYDSIETDYDAYNAAQDRYAETYDRRNLRDVLANQEKTTNNVKLYFYDGKIETLVSENIYTILDVSSDEARVVFQTVETTNIGKIKMSQINSVFDVESKIDESQVPSTDIFVAVNGIGSKMAQNGATRITVRGNKINFIDDPSETDNTGTLMECKIENGKAMTPVKIDEDVQNYRYRNDSDSLIYFKDLDEYGSGVVYENKNKIAADVRIDRIYSFPNSSSLLFYTDYNSEKMNGTLSLYENGKIQKISDDVSSFIAENEKNVVYQTDYDFEKCEGNALLYAGSAESIKIDENVNALLWKPEFIDWGAMYSEMD